MTLQGMFSLVKVFPYKVLYVQKFVYEGAEKHSFFCFHSIQYHSSNFFSPQLAHDINVIETNKTTIKCLTTKVLNCHVLFTEVGNDFHILVAHQIQRRFWNLPVHWF